MEKQEANYQMVKGTVKRNKIKLDERSDGELKTMFKANPETIEKLRNEDVLRKFLSLVKSKEFSEASEILANQVKENFYIYTLKVDDRQEIWIYDGSIYVPNGASVIKEFLRKEILQEFYSEYYAKITLDKIKVDTFIEPEEFFKTNHKYEVPVKNGILNILTQELEPFDPNKIFFSKLNVIYNPSKQCPDIEKFLKSVLKDKEDVKVFYELGGFILLKEYLFEKAFMMVGNGRNGKGKTLELLKRVVGPDNCVSIPLSSIKTDSFSISELFGRMVNLAGDIDNKDLKDTSMFKSLTGRDIVSAKRKFLRDITFENYAKFVFACNDLPMVYDLSKGFWDRWVLLEFPYTFVTLQELNRAEDKSMLKLRDEQIIEKITTQDELSGLLNQFLLALKRLLENKNFSLTRGTEEIKDLWIKRSNSFIAFCMDMLEEDHEDGKIKKKDLRKKYSHYCKVHKIRGKSDIVIKATLQELFGADEERINEQNEFGGYKTERYWVGIKWKEVNS